MCGVTGLIPVPTTPVRSRRSLRFQGSEEKENAPPRAPITARTPFGHEYDSKCITTPLDPPAKRARVEFDTTARPASLSVAPINDTAVEEHALYPLVARERECQVLDQFLGQCLSGKPLQEHGGSLYVSGGPGTGKTCSVRAASDAWRRSRPETQIIHINCMDLSQRSVPGLLRHLANAKGSHSGGSLLVAAAKQLACVGRSVILIVDEVDQLIGKANAQGNGSSSLDALFALPRLCGAPAIAIVCIANAVDLLQRGAVSNTCVSGSNMCRSLLFQPYDADQLRNIVRSRFEVAGATGAAAANALGKITVERRVRQVAKCSGDCRPIVQLCEQAVFEAARVEEDSRATTDEQALGPLGKPIVRPDLAHNDPLRAIQQLPIEQQVLLCALATGTGEALALSEVCKRYKELCKQLHQPPNLATKDQVSDALSSLEQRGLLALRLNRKRGAGGCNKLALGRQNGSFLTAELAVSRAEVRHSVARANPLLKRCLE